MWKYSILYIVRKLMYFNISYLQFTGSPHWDQTVIFAIWKQIFWKKYHSLWMKSLHIKLKWQSSFLKIYFSLWNVNKKLKFHSCSLNWIIIWKRTSNLAIFGQNQSFQLNFHIESLADFLSANSLFQIEKIGQKGQYRSKRLKRIYLSQITRET